MTTESFDGEGGSLIGREADVRVLATFVAGLPRSGGAMLVLGEAGVGKTALLTVIAADAEAEGLRVLRTTGVQYRTEAGFGALRQLLTSAPDCAARAAGDPTLAAILGIDRDTAPGTDAVVEAVLELLAAYSRGLPTLVVLDDAQWLDPASAVVLRQVACRLQGTGAGLVCAARPGDESFFDASGLPAHELGPLSMAASEALLTARFPALAPQVRRRLMADAEGNPLALLELPAALTDSQRTSTQALPRRLPLTHRLQATFASRITALPAATRHLLLTAALDCTGNMQVLRRAMAGRCSMKHLAPAERVQLITVDDTTGRLSFRHSLMRSAVVELSTSDQRRAVHRALAAAWIAVPEQRVWHLAQAAIDPDEEVAALLEDSADLSARRGDGPNAVAALLRAADLSPSGAEQGRRLAKAAYLGANLTGDVRDVPRLLESARQAAPDSDSLPAAMATAVYLLNSYGDIDTAHRLLAGSIALQPQPYDLTNALLLEAMTTLLIVCVHGGRAELWRDFDDAVAQCTSVPDTLGLLRATFADPARARQADWDRLDAAIATLPGISDPVRIVRIATAGAYADRLGALEEPLLHTARGGSSGVNNFPAIQASFLWGSHAFHTGQWTQLREVVGNGLALCDELNYPLRSWTGKWALACLSAVCGDFPAASAHADQMDQWAGSRRGHAIRSYAAHVRTLIALSRGDFEEAHRHACVITPTGSFAPFAGHALWSILDQAEAAVRTGHRADAVEHVRAARALGLDRVSPRLRMVLLASAALAAEDHDEAVRGFSQALSIEGGERWPFDQARIRLYYGERLRRNRAAAQAREQLTAASVLFDRLGAVPWAERADKELRACGSPARLTSRLDAATLTPQQREIASLAAAGLTNKQIAEKLFLSPRTISTHLYQVFPKLGVTSRAALRDALAHVDQMPTP